MKQIILEWPDAGHETNMVNAKRYLNYQEEIADPENFGITIPNPLSIEDTIAQTLLKTLSAIIESGAADEAKDTQQQKIDEAKIRTAEITASYKEG